MPGFEDHSRTLPAIETIINYIDPNAPIGGINDRERHKSTLTLLPYQMTVRDMRPIANSLSFDTTGFVLLDRPSRVTDFWDSTQIDETYLPEIKELIHELTGCEKAVVFGYLRRHNGKNAPETAHKSVHNAHIDYDLPTTRAVIRRVLPPEEAAYYTERRVMQINVWRPLVTVESAPLALCDSGSVARGDLIYGPIGGNSQTGVKDPAGWNLAHNPAHRWYYAPRMRPSEVLAFRLCDSDPNAPQWAAHTSFQDPASTPDSAPRQSIEVRTLALF